MTTELARAKVNLYLHVTDRRDDGYHLLDSLAVFPPVGDVLTLTGEAEPSLAFAGPFGPSLAAEADNLVLRAASLFAEATGYRLDGGLHLSKHLPLASGIGGGSADAAATLRLLARQSGMPIPDDLALGLGADVPVCVASRPARMGGIGEILAPAPGLPAFGLALVNPGATVSTPAIFRARTGPFSPAADLPPRWADAASMAEDLASLGNDLQAPAMTIEPAIGAVLDALDAVPGCLLARMSGSGATCFGIFATAEDAAQAAADLARPGWWTWGGAGEDTARDAAIQTDMALG